MSDNVTGLTALYLRYTGTAGVVVHCDKEKINLRYDNLKLIFSFCNWLLFPTAQQCTWAPLFRINCVSSVFSGVLL